MAWLRGRTYAHRGLHGSDCPENSPSAFDRAVEAGLGIECDVQETADGEAAVFHDWTLERLTDETGPVAARGLSELRQIVLKGSQEDTIPSLRDLLALIGGRVPLLIEIKAERGRPIARLCEAVARSLDGYVGEHAVMSFDPRVGRWFARHSPDTVRGLVVTESGSRTSHGDRRRRLALWRARPDFLAYDVRDLRSAFAAGQWARGLPLLTWTVRTPAQLERALRRTDGYIAEGEGVASAAPKP